MVKVSYNNGIDTAEYGPGIYFIGDPCYVLKDELWQRAIEDAGDFSAYEEFAIAPTLYGDGVYVDVYSGKEFGVDSASLGLVNMKFFAKNPNVTRPLDELGAVVEVNKGLKFEYDEEHYSFKFEIDGTVIFIPTSDEDTQEKEEE